MKILNPKKNAYNLLVKELRYRIAVFPNTGSHLPGSLTHRLRRLGPLGSLCQVNQISILSKAFLFVNYPWNIWQISILSRLFKHILLVNYVWDIWHSLCQVKHISVRRPLKSIQSLNQISKRHLKHIRSTRSAWKSFKTYLASEPTI